MDLDLLNRTLPYSGVYAVRAEESRIILPNQWVELYRERRKELGLENNHLFYQIRSSEDLTEMTLQDILEGDTSSFKVTKLDSRGRFNISQDAKILRTTNGLAGVGHANKIIIYSGQNWMLNSPKR